MKPLFPTISEAEFQTHVEQLAKLLGWEVYHTRDSRRSRKGWPDLVLVRERILFVELKSETGELRPEQRIWLARLKEAVGTLPD